MIVRDIEALRGTERDVRTPNWASVRMLLRSDGMGFSMHETTIFPGTETYIHYANHLEAVYCIEGEGEVETLDDGKVHAIRPGILYALDKHDRHHLRAKTPLRLVCVFNPALTGREVHDENGVYPLLEPEAEKAAAG
ncbi:MAG TPA: ectoine synthase [Burkholderiales bacterium]|nr:ectoine synthase [Burkholderiales bacterium]